MIGKYENEQFITELTTDEQREYFKELIKDMSDDKIFELICHINDIRSVVIKKYYEEGAYHEIDLLSHIF